MTLLALLSIMLLFRSGEAGKLLLLPTPADNSHTYTLRKVYDESTMRGHDATVRPFNCASCDQLLDSRRCIKSACHSFGCNRCRHTMGAASSVPPDV